MKKRWLSLLMLLSVCLCSVSGCKKDDTNAVQKLVIDGNDIVLKVGDTTYSAKDLFGDLLSTESGVKTAYEKISTMFSFEADPLDKYEF